MVQQTLATEKGRDYALAALAERREKAKSIEKVDNGKLHAGSPMTYYCMSCGMVSEVLPEGHWSAPNPFCPECVALRVCGWME